MKRPLTVVGITMLLVLLFLCTTNSIKAAVCLCAVSVMLTVLSLIFNKKRQTVILPTVFFTVAVSCLIFCVFENYYYYPSVMMEDNNAEITVSITDYPEFDENRYHCMAKIKNVNNTKTNIRLSFSKTSYTDEKYEEKIKSLEPGDEVSFIGNIYILGGNSAQAQMRFKSERIFIGAYPTGKVTVKKAEHRGIDYYFKRQRIRTINELLSSFDSETAGVGISVLMGNRKFISNDLYNSFKKSGAAHIMAVSGLHLSVWIMFIIGIIENLGLDRRRWSVFLLCFTVVVMFFADFSGSVVRAGIMMCVYLFGFIIRKNSDALNSLGFSAVIILLINPFAAVNISFLLSFTATFCIVLVSSKLIDIMKSKADKKLKSKTLKKFFIFICSAVITGVSVVVFTMPIMLICFGYFSTMSVLSNLLILPVSSLLIVFFGSFVMFSFIPVLSNVLAFAATAVSKYCCIVVKILGSFKYSTLSPEKETARFICIACLIISLLLMLFIKYRKKFIAFFIAFSFLITAAFSFAINYYQKNLFVTINVFNVGNGLSVTVSQSGKEVLLFALTDDYYVPYIEKGERNDIIAAALPNEQANMRLVSDFLPEKVYYKHDSNNTPSYLRDIIDKDTDSFTFGNAYLTISEAAVYINAFGLKVAVTDKPQAEADIIITNNESYLLDYNEKTDIILSNEYPLANCYSTADNSRITVKISRDANYSVKGDAVGDI